jgi:hypothetical protein
VAVLGISARTCAALSRMSPLNLETVRAAVRRALADFEPAGPPRSSAESEGLLFSSRTLGGRHLPPYYLVYFLFVDLLGYSDVGRWEKIAWTVPVRYRGRLYAIQHSKFGVGIFAPTFEPVRRGSVLSSAPPSPEAEVDAVQMCAAIVEAVAKAEPFFKLRAEQAVSTAKLNVANVCGSLFSRYTYFRDRYRALTDEAERRKDERLEESSTSEDGRLKSLSVTLPSFALWQEAQWNAEAAVEAFFAWTEHVFVHLTIIHGGIRNGDEVKALLDTGWIKKFNAALGPSASDETGRHLGRLLSLRDQIRNFMAHGAFGVRGEAFTFHSGAGAVPVLLTGNRRHPYSFSGGPSLDAGSAIDTIESFVEHLWSGERAPAKLLLFTDLPLNLSWAIEGRYSQAMGSEEDMTDFVDRLTRAVDDAANMDW